MPVRAVNLTTYRSINCGRIRAIANPVQLMQNVEKRGAPFLPSWCLNLVGAVTGLGHVADIVESETK